MNVWFSAILATLIVSAISFLGALTLVLRKDLLNKSLFFLVSLAVGALLGDAFLHNIPEAVEIFEDSLSPYLLVLVGFIIFFILEKVVHFHHLHVHEEEVRYRPFIYTNLIGDGIHNFIDSLLIASAFSASFELGVAASIAVVLHEIPQEFGDFAVLIHGGMSHKRALLWNFLSAVTAVIGAIVGLLIFSAQEALLPLIIPITAGGFIYIAAADLVPELHSQEGVTDEKVKTKGVHMHTYRSVMQILAILLGIFAMYGLKLIEVG